MSGDRPLRRWHAMQGQCLSTTVMLPGVQAAHFSTGGKLEVSSPDAEKHLVYVVEQDDGAQKLYTPAEFRTLVERGRTAEGGRGKAESSAPRARR